MSGRQAKKLRKELRRAAGPRCPLAVRVRATPAGSVQLELSRPAATITLPPAEARAIGEALVRHAEEAG